ncbi:MAG: hypothetical protein V1735_05985 [Nanoarchaeota archaeon]
MTKGFGGGAAATTGLSETQATAKAQTFINDVMLQGQTTATISKVVESNGLYTMTLNVENKEYTSYMTKDGALFFPSGFNIDELSQEVTQAAELPKAEKPTVQLFVMAFCPYGTAAEKAMKPVYDLLANQATFELNFIGNVFTQAELDAKGAQEKAYYEQTCAKKSDDKYYCSLHGDKETMEDIRQLCIMKYSPTKTWDYVNCVAQDTTADWKTCANQFGISTSDIESCAVTEGLVMFQENIKKAEALGVSGSPTIYVNGQSYSGGRTSEGLKTGICSAFTEEPAACGQELSSQQQAVSGSCG